MKGEYVNPNEYIIMTNIIKYDTLNSLTIGTKTLKKIIFNVISKIYHSDYFFTIKSIDKNETTFSLEIGDKYRKKEYDGYYTYIVDVSKKDINEYSEIQNLLHYSYNYISLEFEEKFISIEKNSYKQAIEKFSISLIRPYAFWIIFLEYKNK